MAIEKTEHLGKNLGRNPRRKARVKANVSKIKKMVMLAKPYIKKT